MFASQRRVEITVSTNKAREGWSPNCNDSHATSRRRAIQKILLSVLVCAGTLALPNANPFATAQDSTSEAIEATAELTGLVEDADGNPLAGATVDAWHWFPGNETKTDAEGKFRLTGFNPKRKVAVLVTKEGYAPRHFPQRLTGEKDWVIVLENKTYFEGKITGIDDKPVAGALVRATYGNVLGDGMLINDIPAECTSRDDGTYRLFVNRGTYDFQVHAGARGVFREPEVEILGSEVIELDIQLEEGVRFEANVIDSITAKPIEGFVLWQAEGNKLTGRSNAEGRIVFEGLIPGRVEFNCGGGKPLALDHGFKTYLHGPFGRWWSEDAVQETERFHLTDPETHWQRNFDNLSFDLEARMPPVTIKVEQGVTISGRVTDPKGNPVGGATVAPARTGSGDSLTGDTRYSVRTAADGTYEVVLPASNKAIYNLVAHDGAIDEWRNWANGVSETIQTTPGAKLINFDLKLSEPGTIRGRVLYKGSPQNDRAVTSEAHDKREVRFLNPTTTTYGDGDSRITDKDGQFELKFVRPGAHILRAGDAENRPFLVTVKAGETREGVLIRLDTLNK